MPNMDSIVSTVFTKRTMLPVNCGKHMVITPVRLLLRLDALLRRAHWSRFFSVACFLCLLFLPFPPFALPASLEGSGLLFGWSFPFLSKFPHRLEVWDQERCSRSHGPAVQRTLVEPSNELSKQLSCLLRFALEQRYSWSDEDTAKCTRIRLLFLPQLRRFE